MSVLNGFMLLGNGEVVLHCHRKYWLRASMVDAADRAFKDDRALKED
jgi:hypothetical protein